MADVMELKPTGWFVSQHEPIRNGEITAAARWYWPESTKTEVIHANTDWQWVEADAFIDLSERQLPWKASTEDDVDDWIESQTPTSTAED